MKADHYDTNKAASRLLCFFSYKSELFSSGGDGTSTEDNDEILGRGITMDDFDEDDKKGLTMGTVQLLQERDRAGRGIVMITTTQLIKCSPKTCVSSTILFRWQ